MLDFDWYFYISTVHLGMTEEEFLRSTPRKVCKLWDLHVKFNGWKFKEDEYENNDRVYNMDEISFI